MRVYVCSAFTDSGRASDEARRKNRAMAMDYCRRVIDMGHAPLAPHVFYPTFLDEDTDRELGLKMGLEWLKVCDEIWVFGDNVTAGMQLEICTASEMGIPLQRFWERKPERCTLPGG